MGEPFFGAGQEVEMKTKRGEDFTVRENGTRSSFRLGAERSRGRTKRGGPLLCNDIAGTRVSSTAFFLIASFRCAELCVFFRARAKSAREE